MTSSYQDIYSRFLSKIRDFDFANLDEPNATEMMLGWLRASLSQVYIYRIFSSFNADDEVASMSYELNNSIDDYSDKNFVEELLAYQMVVEWVEPLVNNTTLLNQMITNSKEQKFYSQAQQLSQMQALLESSQHKVRSMIRDRGYIRNSYLGN